MEQDAVIDLFSSDLKQYFDFDKKFDMISSGTKHDGKTLHVYLTDIRQNFLTLAPYDRSVIIKELSPEQGYVYSMLCGVFHPNLEKVYTVLEKDGYFLSINEFIKAPAILNYDKRSISLEEAISQFGCFSERDALIYLCQLCDAVEVLHKTRLTHNDISPKNILLTDAPAWGTEITRIPAASRNFWMKLIDFDISKQPKQWNHAVTAIMGTKPFAAPEILDFRYPTDRVDIYSLGCILHYMLTGKSPKDAMPDSSRKMITLRTLQIIQKCTAGYEKRYPNVARLKRDAMRQLKVYDNPLPKTIRWLPGFRSHTYWKMAVSSYYYCAFILMTAVLITPDNFVTAVLYFICHFMILVIGFDIFHLKNMFPRYTRLLIQQPAVRLAAALLRAIILFILFIIAMYLSQYI